MQAVGQAEDHAGLKAQHKEPAGRIEELLEQQNELMLRQLRLTEESRKKADNVQLMFHSPRTILKTLDPSARDVFKEWHAELRSKVSAYVTQRQLLNRYENAAASNELIAPFSNEAQHTWLWPECYLAQAKDAPSDAFAALRRKHAEEAQGFVMAHQKACVELLSSELTLPRQSQGLVQRAIALAALQKNFFQDPSRAEQLLMQQAQSFAELVYREEMSRADKKIKEQVVLSPKLILALRLLCVLASLISPAVLEWEQLVSLCAMLFALGCGMALFWEEKFMQSMRALLGSSSPQLLSLILQLHQRAELSLVKPGTELSLVKPRIPVPDPSPAEEVN